MNFEQALKEFRSGKPITDGDVVLRPGESIKDLNLGMCMQVDWQIYEEPKWEPEGGSWVIEDDGIVNEYKDIANYSNDFGTTRPTKEQAEAARDKMRVFNRLLAYVDEHTVKGEEHNCCLTIDGYGDFEITYNAVIGAVRMPYRLCNQLINDIGTGKVIL